MVTKLEQLKEVTLAFRGSAAKPGPLAVTISTLTKNDDARKLAASALRFFWKPEAGGPAPAQVSWLRLANSTKGQDYNVDNTVIDPPNLRTWRADKLGYQTVDAYLGLERLFNFWKQIGNEGRGRVQWMAEEGAAADRFLFVWWPQDDPWRQPLLMTTRTRAATADGKPTVTAIEPIEMEVAEPFPDLDGQVNFAQLPAGTMALLEPALTGSKQLIALGREGLVLYDPAKQIYEVSLLKGNPKTYRDMRQTRGLGGLEPPAWAKSVGRLKAGWSVDEGRHLVALVICGPGVWKVRRVGAPGEADVPLFADPELWALSP